MEEYEYLENLNSEELAKIIDQMLDFEETTKSSKRGATSLFSIR